jgi:7-cyano-7-deazaguanine reductase
MSDNQDELNKLVSVHLGKAGDGSIVKPYVTPDEVDASLLVAVPRKLNRTQYDIEEESLPFVGADAWNAYEFSTLMVNGFPVSGWLKFAYSSDTPNIVESKSVKLYLNSYNMAKTMWTWDGLYNVQETIERHMSEAVGGKVHCSIFTGDFDTQRPLNGDFVSLEDFVNVEEIDFSHYNESPEILQVVDSSGRYADKWRSSSLRSNCRVTNQPDWGDVYIHIRGKKTVTPESLLQYIVSMRRENHFHEEICECIYKRLHDMLEPTELLVTCLYTRRGGIDINPIRASNTFLIDGIANIASHNIPCTKTARQ